MAAAKVKGTMLRRPTYCAICFVAGYPLERCRLSPRAQRCPKCKRNHRKLDNLRDVQ